MSICRIGLGTGVEHKHAVLKRIFGCFHRLEAATSCVVPRRCWAEQQLWPELLRVIAYSVYTLDGA